METNNLKSKIGEQVIVTDPYGKKKKQATVEAVNWYCDKNAESICYTVRLNLPSVSKNKYGEIISIHRVFDARTVEFINI